MIKLYDRVFVKSENVTGFVVDIVEDSYTVEKEGNVGPIYWNLSISDLLPVERVKEVKINLDGNRL